MTPWQSLFDRAAEYDVDRADAVDAVARRRAEAGEDDVDASTETDTETDGDASDAAHR
ncbi:MAG: hypothetical protein ABEJ79_05585 [Halolamina sp.]